MISTTELNNVWDAIIPHSGKNIGRRADQNHPLDFYVSFDENHNMQMILVSDHLPALPPSNQQISIRANQRHDGKYAVCFMLTDKSLREQFVSLCWDLMNCTYHIQDKQRGVKEAIIRFRMWQKLFAESKTKRLSDAEIKGLLGELCAFRDVILSNYSPREASAGWIGPIGADRDFEFADAWYEIKSVSLSKDTVSISSLDQLDSNIDGYLLILRIEKTSSNTSGCFSLNSLVNQIRDSLNETETRLLFDSRLASSGYDNSDPRSEESYVLHRIEMYRVDNSFPRVRRGDVSPAVTNGTYTLSIPCLQDWRQY